MLRLTLRLALLALAASVLGGCLTLDGGGMSPGLAQQHDYMMDYQRQRAMPAQQPVIVQQYRPTATYFMQPVR